MCLPIPQMIFVRMDDGDAIDSNPFSSIRVPLLCFYKRLQM